MRKRVLLAVVGCLALGLMATPGQAAPLPTGAQGIQADNAIERVHDGDRYYRWRYRDHDGRNNRYYRWNNDDDRSNYRYYRWNNDDDSGRYRNYDRYRWYYNYQRSYRRHRHDYY